MERTQGCSLELLENAPLSEVEAALTQAEAASDAARLKLREGVKKHVDRDTLQSLQNQSHGANAFEEALGNLLRDRQVAATHQKYDQAVSRTNSETSPKGYTTGNIEYSDGDATVQWLSHHCRWPAPFASATEMVAAHVPTLEGQDPITFIDNPSDYHGPTGTGSMGWTMTLIPDSKPRVRVGTGAGDFTLKHVWRAIHGGGASQIDVDVHCEMSGTFQQEGNTFTFTRTHSMSYFEGISGPTNAKVGHRDHMPESNDVVTINMQMAGDVLLPDPHQPFGQWHEMWYQHRREHFALQDCRPPRMYRI